MNERLCPRVEGDENGDENVTKIRTNKRATEWIYVTSDDFTNPIDWVYIESELAELNKKFPQSFYTGVISDVRVFNIWKHRKQEGRQVATEKAGA